MPLLGLSILFATSKANSSICSPEALIVHPDQEIVSMSSRPDSELFLSLNRVFSLTNPLTKLGIYSCSASFADLTDSGLKLATRSRNLVMK